MKNILFASALMIGFLALAVDRAESSPIKDHNYKSEFAKSLTSFEMPFFQLTCITPHAIAVVEPVSVIRDITYVYVASVTDQPTVPLARCNGPPAGIST